LGHGCAIRRILGAAGESVTSSRPPWSVSPALAASQRAAWATAAPFGASS